MTKRKGFVSSLRGGGVRVLAFHFGKTDFELVLGEVLAIFAESSHVLALPVRFGGLGIQHPSRTCSV